MNILLLGENGILSSRIKKYFQEIKDYKIKSLSLLYGLIKFMPTPA